MPQEECRPRCPAWARMLPARGAARRARVRRRGPRAGGPPASVREGESSRAGGATHRPRRALRRGRGQRVDPARRRGRQVARSRRRRREALRAGSGAAGGAGSDVAAPGVPPLRPEGGAWSCSLGQRSAARLAASAERAFSACSAKSRAGDEERSVDAGLYAYIRPHCRQSVARTCGRRSIMTRAPGSARAGEE